MRRRFKRAPAHPAMVGPSSGGLTDPAGREGIRMASRPSWEGFLKVNLISVPVKAYNAAESGGGKIGFHLVHKECNSRIRYKKVCPVHGEVENSEIVKAYEYAKGKYII